MTEYILETGNLKNLGNKTILIFGAVSGIGRAALHIAHEHGANIAFGDWNEQEGHSIVKELKDRVFFTKCDISSWDDVLNVFHRTWEKFGVIHAVLCNAGVNSHEGFSVDHFDSETGDLLPPDTASISINLFGPIYVTKCALYYFNKWPDTRSQIVLTASAASFFPAPPLHMYCAAKSGVLGFMRALRADLVDRNTTVNVIAPWLTVTPMVLPDWLSGWGNLPINTAQGVARALFLPLIDQSINGKAFFVAGDKIVDFEDSLLAAQPQWAGQQLSDDINRGQKFLLGK